MNQSKKINKLVAALSNAQAEIKAAKKDSKNPYFKSDYADLTSIWEAAKYSITKNGFAVIQTMDYRDDKIILVTTLAHKSGQWMKSFLPLTIIKHDPQAVGSAITYARRYALAAILNICTADDDAENATELNEKDKIDIKREINNDPEIISYFCKRYGIKDLFNVSRAQKTEMLAMIKKRNEIKSTKGGPDETRVA